MHGIHHDPLSTVLHGCLLTHWRTGIACVSGDASLRVPADYGAFYWICEGQLEVHLRSTSTPTLRLRAHDSALDLGGRAHDLMVGAGTVKIDFCQWVDMAESATSPSNGTRFLFGLFPLPPMDRRQLTMVAPEFIRIDAPASSWMPPLKALAENIAAEQPCRTPGWSFAVARLVQLLWAQAIRWHFTSSRLANEPPAGTLDPIIGPVIACMHAQPEHPWTVLRLARETCLARSAFAERFQQLVGQSPMRYLTAIRMQRACGWLRNTTMEIRDIAEQVGYSSASSFSNAFKRYVGKSPMKYRKCGQNEESG